MKKIMIAISVILMFCFWKTSILGVSNVDFNLKSNKESIGSNEEIFITLYSPSNINEEIRRIECVIDYDKSLFNAISKTDITLYNLGKNVEYNEINNTLIISNVNNAKLENILNIKLNSKQDIKNTYTNIKLKEVRVLTNNGYVNIGTITSKLKINDSILTNNTSNIVSNTSLDTSSSLANIDTSLIDQIGNFINFKSLKDLDITSLMLNPLKIFWVFIKAFLIVIVINILAKIICKIYFNYSDILSRRIKSRKLSKVLKDIYE